MMLANAHQPLWQPGQSSLWRALADHVAARRPGTFRAPLPDPVATGPELFDWLRASAEYVRAGDARTRIRLYSGPVQHGLGANLPVADDRSLADYLGRLAPRLGDVGLVVNDVQAVSPEAWRCGQRLLASVVAATGMLPSGASLEIFAGAYKSGFFGVHKDDQDVVTFVVEGRKRFLVWPYEYFADHEDVAAGSEFKVSMLRGMDYSAYRDDAIVLEGGPGDVFYWPAEYWHVAESDGEHTSTLGLGFFHRATAQLLFEQAASECHQEQTWSERDGVPPPLCTGHDGSAMITAIWQELERATGREALRRRLAEKSLAHATAFGFGSLPAQAPALEVAPGTCVELATDGAVAYTIDGDDLLWAVSGVVYRYPAAPAIVELIRRVAAGGPLLVDDLVGELGDAQVGADVLRHVLAVIARHHGLVPSSSRSHRVRIARTQGRRHMR